jgi:hypothetical protein
MLVDDPHITIFRIIFIVNMTREALGLHSLSLRYSKILITALNRKSRNACAHLKDVSGTAICVTFWYAMGAA